MSSSKGPNRTARFEVGSIAIAGRVVGKRFYSIWPTNAPAALDVLSGTVTEAYPRVQNQNFFRFHLWSDQSEYEYAAMSF